MWQFISLLPPRITYVRAVTNSLLQWMTSRSICSTCTPLCSSAAPCVRRFSIRKFPPSFTWLLSTATRKRCTAARPATGTLDTRPTFSCTSNTAIWKTRAVHIAAFFAGSPLAQRLSSSATSRLIVRNITAASVVRLSTLLCFWRSTWGRNTVCLMERHQIVALTAPPWVLGMATRKKTLSYKVWCPIATAQGQREDLCWSPRTAMMAVKKKWTLQSRCLGVTSVGHLTPWSRCLPTTSWGTIIYAPARVPWLKGKLRWSRAITSAMFAPAPFSLRLGWENICKPTSGLSNTICVPSVESGSLHC